MKKKKKFTYLLFSPIFLLSIVGCNYFDNSGSYKSKSAKINLCHSKKITPPKKQEFVSLPIENEFLLSITEGNGGAYRDYDQSTFDGKPTTLVKLPDKSKHFKCLQLFFVWCKY
ncbi:hypothetical protein JTY60_00030 [symbiont of Argiope bruennichi]|uniref:hypothetical protein n=1 Tax=symbiont of Argiope bruennichi TaxID=2810479 RepID=UPI003DA2C455